MIPNDKFPLVLAIGMFFGLLFNPVQKALAGDMDFSGYFRAPIGANSVGGKQIQLSNPGTEGNEFRLGNETGYGELNLLGHVVKASDKSDSVMDALFTLAINPPLNTQYGDYPLNSTNLQIVQAYLFGHFYDSATYWVGKRFNRWGYVIMDDFFYFADMSGNGMGVEKILTSNGELAFSVLQFVDSTISGTDGNPAKDAIEMRWRNVQIFSDNDSRNNFDFWLAAAMTSPGTGISNSGTGPLVSYSAGHGAAFGARWNHKLIGGVSEASVQVGTGVMQSLILNQDAAAINDTLNHEMRIRLLENYNLDINPEWSLRTALVYETMNYNDAGSIQHRWSSLGLRPGYNISERLQLLLEMGFSSVVDDTEVVGPRTISRISFGPQWGITRGLNANPVIRVMAAYSTWNGANATTSDTNSLVSQYMANNGNSTALNGKLQMLQLGVEAEMSF